MRPALIVATQTAFIAIASRMIAAFFRIAESFHPTLRTNTAVLKPEVVIKREALTMGMAWTFALLTNMIITPLAVKRGFKAPVITFMSAMIGTLIAETVGRTLAYRKIFKAAKQKKSSLKQPEVQQPADSVKLATAPEAAQLKKPRAVSLEAPLWQPKSTQFSYQVPAYYYPQPVYRPMYPVYSPLLPVYNLGLRPYG